MTKKHRKSWTEVYGSRVLAPSGYWVAIVELESDAVFRGALNVLDWLTCGFGYLFGEPRYRVVVGRSGTESTVGVHTSKTLRRAWVQLAEVRDLLNHAPAEDARAALDLDF